MKKKILLPTYNNKMNMNQLIKNAFDGVQKVTVATLCIVLAVSFFSCTSKIENGNEIVTKESSNETVTEESVVETVTDMEANILGKWELVLVQNANLGTKYPHTPKGYVEYLTDGRLAWYDYEAKEHTLFEEKYWLSDNYELPHPLGVFHVDDGLVLHYETELLVDETGRVIPINPGPDFGENPDKPHGNQFHLTFIDQNTMILYSLEMWSFAGIDEYVYKQVPQN